MNKSPPTLRNPSIADAPITYFAVWGLNPSRPPFGNGNTTQTGEQILAPHEAPKNLRRP